MARKRQRRRPAGDTATDHQGHHDGSLVHHVHVNGDRVKVHQISAQDEGLLYTHRIMERRGTKHRGVLAKIAHLITTPLRAWGMIGPSTPTRPSNAPRTSTRNGHGSPRLRSDTLTAAEKTSFFGSGGGGGSGQEISRQYTIMPKKKFNNNFLNWIDKHHMNCVVFCCGGVPTKHNVDSNVYKPGKHLYGYIHWTFTASFMSVFLSFLLIFSAFNVAFGGLLMLAGNREPNCIMMAGEPFGTTPNTKFSDAFALSWTTFTTVGYGMTYTSVGSNLADTHPRKCTWVVTLCTTEAFFGLLFAGMCAAILFGKVNRVQSHANLIFSNAVCLQYEEINFDDDDDESERPESPKPPEFDSPPQLMDEENQRPRLSVRSLVRPFTATKDTNFIDEFNGCPVLKFQVVNEFSNREGSEIVDCMMKVIGIKFKGTKGRVTHSQYVRVNLVDFEHPFLSRVWHGVHILDATSPLLTNRAKHRILENNGSWPSNWFDPDIIRTKLEIHDLIVTVVGLSNVSAVTVHAYKRYKVGDVLIGFNFAPLVFRDTETGKLEVDLSLANDVREQVGFKGEDLALKRQRSDSLDNMEDSLLRRSSTIQVTKSKSADALENTNPANSIRTVTGPEEFADMLTVGKYRRKSTSRKDSSDDDDLPPLPITVRKLSSTSEQLGDEKFE